jgi:hypothetical protein
MPNPLPVLICYSRSGGTLMNRILGSLENVIVLSEVNPWGAFKPMLEQAQDWFGLINDEEKKDLQSKGFVQQVDELQKKAINRNLRLIIRDWSAANFMKGLVRKKTPSYKLETIEELKKSFPLKPLVLTRDPYTTWKSNFENFQKYFDLDKETFFYGYEKYLHASQSFPRIRLEDFTAFPQNYVRWICEYWDLPFSANGAENFHAFDRCTGENTLAKKMDGRDQIRPVRIDPWPTDLDLKTKRILQRAYAWTSYEVSPLNPLKLQ